MTNRHPIRRGKTGKMAKTSEKLWKRHFVGSQTDIPKGHTLIHVLPPANAYTKLCLHSQKEKIRWLGKSRAHNLCVITKDNTWFEQLEFQWVVSNYCPWTTIWGENAPIWVYTFSYVSPWDKHDLFCVWGYIWVSSFPQKNFSPYTVIDNLINYMLHLLQSQLQNWVQKLTLSYKWIL